MATVVVSYSRTDRAQVKAVVALLKAALRGIDHAVFWDEDFEPGDPWFEQICQHIDAAPQLFVFWCAHAATSEQVRREFSYAMQRGKRIVPVLMDDTALTPELALIHGIDLRGAVQHGPVSLPPTPVSEAGYPRSRRAALPARLIAIAATLTLLVAISLMWTLNRSAVPDATSPSSTAQTDPTPDQPAPTPDQPVPTPDQPGPTPDQPTPDQPLPPPVQPNVPPTRIASRAGLYAAAGIAVMAALGVLLIARRRRASREVLEPAIPAPVRISNRPGGAPVIHSDERVVAAFAPFIRDGRDE